jgi:hypothetical protein
LSHELLRDEVFVLVSRNERAESRDGNGEEPAGSVGVGIDEFGRVDDGLIRFDNVSRNGCEQFADRLGRLRFTDDGTSRNGSSGLGKIDVDDVAESVGCVLGDSDDGRVAFDANPFVFGGVFEVTGNVHERAFRE